MPVTPTKGFYVSKDIKEYSIICGTPSTCKLPAGATSACYATPDTKYPTRDQFCGYVKDGVVYGAPGCCAKVCPGPCHPDVSPRDPTPLPFDTKIDETVKSTSPTAATKDPGLFSIPTFTMLILLAFLILIAGAFIFLSIGM
jgi:hypothetical protein